MPRHSADGPVETAGATPSHSDAAPVENDVQAARGSHRLATFPEQNPNAVIETDRQGHITYLNPVARQQLPELADQGRGHPMLQDWERIVDQFERGEAETVAREVEVGQATYEQKICFTRQDDELIVRIYAHDITDRKQAAEAIQSLARQVVVAQEAERHRVARELHDEAGQALTALKIGLQLIKDEMPSDAEPVSNDLARAITLVDDTRQRIRALAHGLRPPALDTLGLNDALEEFCRSFSDQTGLEISYQGADLSAAELPDATGICLYRVLQESLTNVVRHADASRARVRLERDANTLRLVVEDDGRGFDHDQLKGEPPSAGLGLRGMHERLTLLGGELSAGSADGGGARIEARLPMGSS